MKEDTEGVSDSANDEKKGPSNIMINAEGQRVEAIPDMASWEQYKAKAEASAAKKDDSVADSKELEECGLACPIDKRLFVDPMKTPCCGRTYCNDCIENALVNSDLVCPGCNSEGVLFDNLTADEDMTKKIKEYQEEKAAKAKAAEQERGKKPSPSSSSNESKKAPSPTPLSNPKKRIATDELPNDRQKTKSPPGSKPQSPQQKPKSPVKQSESPKDNVAPNSIPAGPKSEQDFIKQMNELAKQHGTSNQMNGMPMPNGFPSFPMPNMMGMPNPMMVPNNMNPFAMGMMGFPGMMPGNNGSINFNGNGINPNNNWNSNNNTAQVPPTGPKAYRNQFSHQQASRGNEDDAYMRKPLNPNRAAHRNRRARPTDYKELGA